jgi:hypothetical protein
MCLSSVRTRSFVAADACTQVAMDPTVYTSHIHILSFSGEEKGG